MICVSVDAERLRDLLAALEGIDFAEVRLERLRPGPEALREIFGSGARRVATMRPGTATDAERVETLVCALEHGAAYVDVELESSAAFSRTVIGAARRFGRRVIASFHDFAATPDDARLRRIVDDCFALGADIAKVACKVVAPADGARLLALIGGGRPVIPVGMGELGRITRIAAPLLGSPFTFASRGPGTESAPGQIDAATMRRLLAEIGHA